MSEARNCSRCVFYSPSTGYCLRYRIFVKSPDNPPCQYIEDRRVVSLSPSEIIPYKRLNALLAIEIIKIALIPFIFLFMLKKIQSPSIGEIYALSQDPMIPIFILLILEAISVVLIYVSIALVGARTKYELEKVYKYIKELKEERSG